MYRLTAACAFASLVACSAAPPVAPPLERPIIGGITDANDPGVVLVIAQSNVQGGGASLCSGEVVSPHVVMTAAHCVDPATVGNNNTFYIFIGSDLNNQTQANNKANFYGVAETHFNMLFNPNQLGAGNDIAVVITKSALPIAPLPMNRTPLTNGMIGQAIRLVGYGINNGADTMGVSAGTKRQVMTTLQQFDSKLLSFGDAQHNTCEGDSGGPAFMMINGKEVIAGITSFGDQGCMQYGADTRVDVYASSFVDPYIKQFDGNNPPPADMAMGGGPVDMAMSGVRDLSIGGGPRDLAGADLVGQKAQLGDACTQHADCQSGTCAVTGAAGYCTQACDPMQPGVCTNNTVCGVVDGQSYCIRASGRGASGCAVAPTDGNLPGVGCGALLLLGLALLARRRSVA